MLSMMFYLMFLLMILIMLMLINLIFSKKMNKNREKMSSFECGFDSISPNRLPFSLQFYLITIIFLIFDVEIALILPMINANSFMYFIINFNINLIMMILLMGLYLEMKEGALKWFK